MAPKDTKEDRNDTPDPVEKGLATKNTLRYDIKKRLNNFAEHNGSNISLIFI